MTPATNRQVPEHSIMDIFGKQTYLGNSFSATSGLVAVTTSEVPFIFIACPSQNTAAPSNARALFCSIKKMLCNDAARTANIIYRVYLNASAISAGTVFAPVQMRPANSNASIASVLISPTFVTKGTLVGVYSVGVEGPDAGSDLIILDANQNMLITAQASAASSGAVNLQWNEF